MEREEVRELDPETFVRLACIETLNQGEIGKTEKFYTDDAVYYASDDTEGTVHDLISDAEEFREAFPNMEASIDEVVADDDQMAFRYTVRGTQEGPFKQIPPTGESFETQGIGFAELDDGLITEYDLVFDRLGMLRQLGVMG